MSESLQLDFTAFAARLPQAVVALRTLSTLSGEGMDKALVELIKVRASQLNGCAYCLQLHLGWARQAGVAQGKLDQVAVWQESPGFTPRERAALAWTETLTKCAGDADTDSARQSVHQHFSEEQVLRLTLAIAAINAWNRIAGPLGFTPPSAE